MTNLPTFIFGFANSETSYLSNLNPELNNIHSALMSLDAQHKLKVVPISILDHNTLFNTFNNYSKQIVAFHYGGHADSENLHLFDSKANHKGIAILLGIEKNLKFVFLNGCSTYGQVEQLFKQGVKVVIATKGSIDDKQAMAFSSQFYNALALGKNIREAFSTAIAFIESKSGDSEIWNRGIVKKKPNSIATWGLYFEQKNEDCLKWTVYNEINDSISIQTNQLQAVLTSPTHRDWAEQIKKDIKNFKPKTALEHLLKIENSISEINDITIKAIINHLKGICYDEIGEKSNAHQAHLRAYILNNNIVAYKEKALIVYTLQKDNNTVLRILDEIQNIEPYNAISWAVKVIISKGSIQERINDVPNEVFDLLEESQRFKSILMYLMIEFQRPKTEMFEVFEGDLKDKNLFPHEINFDNRSYWIRLASLHIELSVGVKSPLLFPDQRDISLAKDKNLDKGVKLLKAILHNFENTEKKEFLMYYYYILALGNYLIEGTQEYAIEMYNYFLAFKNKSELEILYVSFALCQTKCYDKVINISNDEWNIPPIILIARHFALAELGKLDESKNCFSIYFERIDTIKGYDLFNFVSYCMRFTKSEDEKIAFFDKYSSKFFSKIEYQIAEVIAYRDSRSREWILEKLENIKNEKLSKDYKSLLAIIYVEANEFEIPIQLLGNDINFEEESREYFIYILCMIYSSHDDEKLLGYLQNWRDKNFTPNQIFLEREIHLLIQTGEWDKIEEVTSYGLKYDIHNSILIFYYLYSLKNQKKNKDVAHFLTENILNIDHSQDNSFRFAKLAIDEGLYDIALKLTYPFAKEKENILARDSYFHIFSFSEFWQEIVLQKECVEGECIVVLESEGETLFMLISETTEKYNELTSQLKGRKVNEVVELKNNFTNKSKFYEIKAIHDKYGGLLVEIGREINKGRPFGGAFHSVNFTDFDDMEQKLMELWGKEGEKTKKEKERIWENYKQQKIGYTELVISIRNKPIDAFYMLLAGHESGFIITPRKMFELLPINIDQECVLDFTSVLLFFELQKKHNIQYNKKFWVSKFLIDIVREEIEETFERNPFASLEITTKKIRPHFLAEDFYDKRREFLKEILEWIEQNCKTRPVREKLKMINKLKLKNALNNELYQQYVFDTMFLSDNENHILISDDSFFSKFFFEHYKIVSTEYYLYLSQNEDYIGKILPKLIQFNYQRITITEEILNAEYDNYIKQEANFYINCLKNLSIMGSYQTEYGFLALNLIQKIYTSPILIERKRALSQQVFSYLFLNLERHSKVEKMFPYMIYSKFRFLPNYINYAIEDFKIVWNNDRRLLSYSLIN